MWILISPEDVELSGTTSQGGDSWRKFSNGLKNDSVQDLLLDVDERSEFISIFEEVSYNEIDRCNTLKKTLYSSCQRRHEKLVIQALI